MPELYDDVILPDMHKGAFKSVILHWTVGNYNPSAFDKIHYHYLIDGDNMIHKGLHSVKANARPFNRFTPYAAHALNYNAGTIGVSLCGMVGCNLEKRYWGKQPITKGQIITASKFVARLCLQYGINVENYTGVMQHGEIQLRTGVIQRGKWDCNVWPFNDSMTPSVVQSAFRNMVKFEYNVLRGVNVNS